MLGSLSMIASAMTFLLLGIGVGAAWICAIAAPNVFYDKLDASRANTQVRALIHAGSTPISGVLLAAAASAVLAGAYGAGVLSGLAALGFFLNRWTLSPHEKGDAPKGVRRRRTGQRLVAVGVSLGSLVLALIAAVLAVFGI